MATKTANQASAGVQPKALRVGLVNVVATYSLDQSLSNGDVVQMLKVPVGARLVDGYLIYASSGQGSLIVGDGVDTDRYITQTAISAGVTATVRFNGIPAPYSYSTDDTIDVMISASAPPSTGAIYLVAQVEYPGP